MSRPSCSRREFERLQIPNPALLGHPRWILRLCLIVNQILVFSIHVETWKMSFPTFLGQFNYRLALHIQNAKAVCHSIHEADMTLVTGFNTSHRDMITRLPTRHHIAVASSLSPPGQTSQLLSDFAYADMQVNSITHNQSRLLTASALPCSWESDSNGAVGFILVENDLQGKTPSN